MYPGDGQPDASPNKRCGQYYHGKFYTRECDADKPFVCKLGPKACAPKGMNSQNCLTPINTIFFISVANCPAGWIATEDSCFKYVNDVTLSWADAERKCAETEGATLPSCLSTEQVNFLRGSRVWTHWKNYWIGTSD